MLEEGHILGVGNELIYLVRDDVVGASSNRGDKYRQNGSSAMSEVCQILDAPKFRPDSYSCIIIS